MGKSIVVIMLAALLVSTAVSTLIAWMFSIPWVIGLVVGVLLATWWSVDHFILKPSKVRELVFEIKEAADSALSLEGRPYLHELIGRLQNKLDDLLILKDGGDREAEALLSQFPPFFQNSTVNYVDYWCMVTRRVTGEYLASHPDLKKKLEDQFWLMAMYLLLIAENIKALLRKEKG